MWTVEIKKSALKYIERLPKKYAIAVMKAIDEIAADPFHAHH